MYDSNGPASLDDMQRVPSFTLATALVLLGHNCPGGCPRTATECRAAVWFVRLPDDTRSTWTRTLVEVAFLDVPRWGTRSRYLIGAINECVRPDHLRVRARTEQERAALVVALADRRRSRVPEIVGSSG